MLKPAKAVSYQNCCAIENTLPRESDDVLKNCCEKMTVIYRDEMFSESHNSYRSTDSTNTPLQ